MSEESEGLKFQSLQNRTPFTLRVGNDLPKHSQFLLSSQ